METNPLIALLTDFGLEDPYVGILKGAIYSISPDARIVDITHKIQPHDITQGAFILSRVMRYFPLGTIFVAVVDPGVGSQRKAVAARTESYRFVGPDNGLLSLALERSNVEKIVEINNPSHMLLPISDTFHGRDIFAPAAAYISQGISLNRLGPSMENIQCLDFSEISVSQGGIVGHIVFSDHFGNLVTDIDSYLLEEREIKSVRVGRHEIKKISRSYSETRPGELLAIRGSFDTLEIAANKDSASKFLKADPHERVEVIFS